MTPEPDPLKTSYSDFVGPLRNKIWTQIEREFMLWVKIAKQYAQLQTSEEGFEMVIKFIESILLLRCRWSFSVTSWGRTEKHNKAVGGVDGSYHLLWLGLDVELDENKKNVTFEKDCSLVGIVALWEGDHYHLQPSGISRP